MVAADEVKIMGISMLHELMTRTQWVLPDEKSRFITLKKLLLIREGKIFGLREEKVQYKQCTRPPCSRVLCEILHGYLKPLGIDSGIDTEKENFPDKEWLVLAVASLSGGQDPIFARDYVPAANQLKRSVPQ
jgi:hypothetical protein